MVAARVTPDTIQQDWPTYRTAVQVKPGDKVHVRMLRAPTDDEMRELLLRISGLKKVSDANFMEVHKLHPEYPNRTTVVIGNISASYPREDEEFDTDMYVSGVKRIDTKQPNELDKAIAVIDEQLAKMRSKVDVDEEWPSLFDGELKIPMYNFTLSVLQ